MSDEIRNRLIHPHPDQDAIDTETAIALYGSREEYEYQMVVENALCPNCKGGLSSEAYCWECGKQWTL